MAIVKMGTLYLNGQPVAVGGEHDPGADIWVGDTVEGKEINWVIAEGLLVADRCLLMNVSWDELFQAGFLDDGKNVTLNGIRYQARLLMMSGEKKEPNEWDKVLDIVGEDNDIWHWNKQAFWGQEQPFDIDAPFRGRDSARKWNYYDTCARSEDVGFRPALEPVFAKTNDVAENWSLAVWSGQSQIVGRVNEVNGYDIVLSAWEHSSISGADQGRSIIILPDGRLVIDRAAIAGFQRLS